MSRPKVLQVCVFGGTGGVEHHVLALSRSLALTAEVVVVAAEGGWLDGAARLSGLAVATVPEPRGNFDRRTISALRRVLREQRPDVVHSHLGRSDWYVWLALMGSPRVALVTTEHGISENRQDLFVTGARRSLHEFAHGLRFRRTDAVIAVSASTAGTLKKRYPVLRRRPPVVIPPGLDDARLFEIPRPERAAGSPLRIVVVARLAEEKGVDVALRAYAALRESGVSATLTVVGSGPEAEPLADLAAELGAADVTFAGRLDDVSGALAEADVFLLTSRSENLPIALLEGMAAGLPAVASRVGGVPEVVGDGVDGILVPVDDVAAVVSALALLARDEPVRAKMGAAAREAARSQDMVHTVQAVGQVYESLR